MSSFSERLREERIRVGQSQQQFAVVGGVQRRAQTHYESGERTPDAIYLAALARIGVDLFYLLTGERSGVALTSDEQALLTGYRSLDATGRAGVLGMIGGMAQQISAMKKGNNPTKVQQNFEGANIGQQVSGDVTAPFSINMTSKRTAKKRES